MELRKNLKMGNQGSENKSRNNKFNFHEFIQFISDLVIYLHIYTYIIYYKKFGKFNVNRSSLIQHPMDIPNITGVHGPLYGAW